VIPGSALRIDAVALPGGGRLGMTHCPGRLDSLANDLDTIRDWGAVAVVTLMETEELAQADAANVGVLLQARGIAWHHAPIEDYAPPGPAFEQAWLHVCPALLTHFAAGHGVLLHCFGGLGRTGTVAARLLVELGEPPQEAIARIRQTRPGTIETAAQEAHVLAIGIAPA
jgi:ADP-ribosyl-[dinitrogen reductase] hydrolase